MAERMLRVLYPGYTFPENLLPETLITMVSQPKEGSNSGDAILKLMKTRQCYLDSEKEQDDFFDMRRYLRQQKGPSKLNRLPVVLPPPIVRTATPAGHTGSQIRPTLIPLTDQPVDGEGEKVSEIDERRLRRSNAYIFKQKDQTIYAYPITSDVPLSQSLHSKYWFILQAIRHLHPTYEEKTFKRGVSGIDVISSGNATKITSLVKLLRGEEPHPEGTDPEGLLTYWARIIEQMFICHSEQDLDTFNTLLQLSDPDHDPVVPCFLDALQHYVVENPPPPGVERKYKDSFQADQSLGNKYMPSDQALSDTEPRWSHLFQDLLTKYSKTD